MIEGPSCVQAAEVSREKRAFNLFWLDWIFRLKKLGVLNKSDQIGEDTRNFLSFLIRNDKSEIK